MLKRILSIILALTMVLSMSVVSVFADSKGATKSTQNMNIDGVAVSTKMEVYNIYNNNYFKLRDIAYLLKSTNSKFSVDWDAASSLIKIETGKDYVSVGGELSERGDLSKKAKKIDQALLIDGEKVTGLTVYNVAGNNFFKLRDLGDALGFEVDWNAADNAIEISTGAETPYKLGSYAEACGLPKNIAKISNPKTISDYSLNLLYEMYCGNYTPTVQGVVAERRSLKLTCLAMGTLCGAYANQTSLINFNTSTSKWTITANNMKLSTKEVYDRNVQAYNKAVEIVNGLISSGKLTKDMSDMNKAKAIYDYLIGSGYGIAGQPSNNADAMLYDDAYACLVAKNCNCGGSAAAYVMLARVAGLKAFTLSANAMKNGSSTEIAGGHVVEYMLLDGKEYIADVHNKNGILSISDMTKYNQYDPNCLDVVRDLANGDYSTVVLGKNLVAEKQSDGKIKLTFENADILPSAMSSMAKDGTVLIYNNNGIDPGNGDTSAYITKGTNCLYFDAAKWSSDNSGATATGLKIPYKSFNLYAEWK